MLYILSYHDCATIMTFFSTTVECENHFVDISYNSADSTITCTFLNKMDNTTKSCSVRYGPCDNVNKTINDDGHRKLPNTVVLQVTNPNSSFCYVVTASNGSFTLVVEGRLIQSK